MASYQHMSNSQMAWNYGVLTQKVVGLEAENEALRQQVKELIAKETVRLEKQREANRRHAAARRAEKMLSVSSQTETLLPPLDPEAEKPIQELPASPVAETPATRTASRDFSRLHEAVPYNTLVYVDSLGERMEALVMAQGLVSTVGNRVFKSPTAMCKAHAQRITAVHPQPTKPGNGWVWVKLAATGQSIGEVYDAHFNA